jgi:hypothetical protein
MFTETLNRSFWLMPTYNGRRGVRHLSDDARAIWGVWDEFRNWLAAGQAESVCWITRDTLPRLHTASRFR